MLMMLISKQPEVWDSFKETVDVHFQKYPFENDLCMGSIQLL